MSAGRQVGLPPGRLVGRSAGGRSASRQVGRWASRQAACSAGRQVGRWQVGQSAGRQVGHDASGGLNRGPFGASGQDHSGVHSGTFGGSFGVHLGSFGFIRAQWVVSKL